MSEVRVRGARKAYPGRPPVVALDGIDLTVPAGSVTVVLGESGSGKTTLLRVIAGFERLDDGVVELAGTVVSSAGTSLPPERRRVGVVPQEGALFPHLDVAANVSYGLPRSRRRGVDGRVRELLDMVGLAGYERRFPHQLSGGQQQRVAVARALAPDPAVVLLDEPFAALDTTLRARLRHDVATALRATGATAIVVTHDPSEAMALADQLAVMRFGRIVQIGAPRQVYRNPADAAAAAALGPVTAIPGVVRNGDAVTALGTVAAPARPDGVVDVLVRPEQIVPVPEADAPDAVKATVASVEFQGSEVVVGLRVGDAGDAVLAARWPAHAEPNPGDTVSIALRGAPLAVVPAAATPGNG